MGLRDGIPSLEFFATTISGTQLQGNVISGVNVIGSAVSNRIGNLTSLIAGSPNDGTAVGSQIGLQIIGGISAISSGAGGWIIFPTAFNGNPNAVLISQAIGTPPGTTFNMPSIRTAGSVVTGSFWAQVSGAQTGSVYYIAIGP